MPPKLYIHQRLELIGLGVNMGVLGDFAEGFLVMAVAIWILNIITLVVLGQTWTGLLFLLVLLIPISMIAYEYSKYKKKEIEKANAVDRVEQILVSLYGVSFACWLFDVSTTYYAINVLDVAAEQNPLGWPFGALGALIFFIPASAFTYFLLFKVRQRYSLLAAVLVTALTLCISSMNLFAGFQNFGFFTTYSVSFSTETCSYLFGVVILVDSLYALVFIRLTKLTRPQWLKVRPSLSVVAIVLSSLALVTSLAQPTCNFLMSNNKQEGKPSFDLSNFYVAYTYTYIEIRNNGTATAHNIFVTFYFLKPLDSNYQWATIGCIPEIREGGSAILTIPVGRYHLESTYSGTNITDYEAYVAVFCVHKQSEIHANFHLEDFQVLPPPDM
jgi:hypothetical protein